MCEYCHHCIDYDNDNQDVNCDDNARNCMSSVLESVFVSVREAVGIVEAVLYKRSKPNVPTPNISTRNDERDIQGRIQRCPRQI